MEGTVLKDNAQSKRQFTVVMRGSSAFFFLPEKEIHIQKYPISLGTVDIKFRTRWLKRNDSVTLPGQLWIEVKGEANDLEESLVPFANAGFAFLPVFSLSANAAVNFPAIEVAFDSTPNIKERNYFQCYVPPESDVIHFARVINIQASLALLDAIAKSADAERIHRAANQYQLALESWMLGSETLSLAHLWMAVEVLTKTVIRFECKVRGINSENELATALNVELSKLDSTIRRDFILGEDEECYRKAKKASDGFEHGFLGYTKIRELTMDIRHRMAGYVRETIFRVSSLDAETHKTLTEDPYHEPMGIWPLVKYLRGQLIGEGAELAAKGNEYPFIRWRPVIQEAEVTENGKLNIKATEEFQLELGEGIVFQLGSHEVWRPD